MEGGFRMADGGGSFAVTVFTFPSTHYALKAEKICQEAGVKALLIPLPRDIRADCGLALILRPAMRLRAEELLKGQDVRWDGVHQLAGEGRQGRMWKNLLADPGEGE
jgi:hypothetical protein